MLFRTILIAGTNVNVFLILCKYLYMCTIPSTLIDIYGLLPNEDI